MTGLVTQNDINRPLVGLSVGQRGERAAQARQRQLCELMPVAAYGIVAVAGIDPFSVPVHGQAVVGSEEQTLGRLLAGFGADFQILPHRDPGRGGEPAEATYARLAAGEADESRVQIDELLRQRAQVLRGERPAQCQPAGGAHPGDALHAKEGPAELIRRVSLVAVGGAGGDVVVGGLAEVRPVLPRPHEQPGLTASRRRPVGEGLDVDHLAADTAGGDAGQVLQGVGAEFRRPDGVCGLVRPGNLDEEVYFADGIIIGATGELPRDAGGESLIQPRLVGVAQFLDGHGAGRDPRDGDLAAAAFGADGVDAAVEQPRRLGHGAWLADVAGATVEGLVPAVLFGDEALGGAQLLVAHADLGKPVGQDHAVRSSMTGVRFLRSLRSSLRYGDAGTLQDGAGGDRWEQPQNTRESAVKVGFSAEKIQATFRSRTGNRRFTKPESRRGGNSLNLSLLRDCDGASYVTFLRNGLGIGGVA